ncbi:hypothetical protein GCM10022600_14860 [Qipengyuania pelagi]
MSSLAVASILARVFAVTLLRPLSARDAVATETPAALATSLIVIALPTRTVYRRLALAPSDSTVTALEFAP